MSTSVRPSMWTTEDLILAAPAAPKVWRKLLDQFINCMVVLPTQIRKRSPQESEPEIIPRGHVPDMPVRLLACSALITALENLILKKKLNFLQQDGGGILNGADSLAKQVRCLF